MVKLMVIKNPHSWLISDLDDVPKNNINVFETFACGGGSSLGYKLAGCNVIGGNDIDAEMAYHYKLNLKPKYYYLCPVKQLVNNKSLPDDFFNLDILSGSPPCSSFSMAGNREKDWGKKKHFREGQSEQILDDLFFDYLDLVDYLKPKVCIAENVKGLIQGNAKGYVKLIMERFREVGYRCQLFLVNAADCGVPQRRERVFFIALRNDIDKPKLILAPQHRWVSAGEATSDLQVLTDDEIKETAPAPCDLKWWHLTNSGEDYCSAVKKKEGKERLWAHKKLDGKMLSNSLTVSDTFTHWDVCRRLTYREWKRLGSFPDDYQAKNDKIGKYMIGMSVPPKMTKTIATVVIEQWLS
jgi:DNA (cytosine-5)-methyltransferase 1